jgi:hypothetical protein
VEHHAFDVIALALVHAHYHRIQGRALGQAVNHLPAAGAHELIALRERRGRTNLRALRIPLSGQPVGLSPGT